MPKGVTVYVLTRTMDGDVVVDGVFRSKEGAEAYKLALAEEFDDTNGEYHDWEIHSETLQD